MHRLRAQFPHNDRVRVVAFHPHEPILATGSQDWTAKLWNSAGGKELATLHHQGPVKTLAFSADGKYLLTGSDDHTARLWEATGKPLATLEHLGPIVAVAFSPDSQLALTASRDQSARLWKVPSGEAVGQPMWHLQGLAPRCSARMASTWLPRAMTTAPACGTFPVASRSSAKMTWSAVAWLPT